MSLSALNEHYADESRSYAVGFAKWLLKNCDMVDDDHYILHLPTSTVSLTVEKLYDLYIKQLEKQWQTQH